MLWYLAFINVFASFSISAVTTVAAAVVRASRVAAGGELAAISRLRSALINVSANLTVTRKSLFAPTGIAADGIVAEGVFVTPICISLIVFCPFLGALIGVFTLFIPVSLVARVASAFISTWSIATAGILSARVLQAFIDVGAVSPTIADVALFAGTRVRAFCVGAIRCLVTFAVESLVALVDIRARFSVPVISMMTGAHVPF